MDIRILFWLAVAVITWGVLCGKQREILKWLEAKKKEIDDANANDWEF